MNRILLALALALALLTGARGQYFSFEINPQVVVPGNQMVLLITATQSNPGAILTVSWNTVHVGTPNGPLVTALPSSVGPLQFQIAPGQGHSWNLYWPATLTGPVYYLDLPWTFGSTSGVQSIPIYVTDPSRPRLIWDRDLRVGRRGSFHLSAPAFAGSPYIALISNGTNTGFPLIGGHVAVDPFGPFWDAAFPTPHPALFNAFQGTVGSGGPTSIGIVIPPLPQLAHMQLAVQVVIDSGLAYATSNTLLYTIRP